MSEAKKKYQTNLKNLREENIKLRIENEVIRKQLISIRNILNEILGVEAERIE
jgi:hypothetical protein